ncbi:hypothetical protein KQI52_07280 [bacterium]|nr:hypothetical protein [bacterium]
MNQTMSKSGTKQQLKLPDIIVEAAMVNPEGKASRIGSKVPNDLLNREWVQLRNMTDRPLLLNGLELRHMSYHDSPDGKLVKVLTLQGQLAAHTYLRIHSGIGKPRIDPKRRIIHAFVGSKLQQFYYQIARGDTIAIMHPRGAVIDQATYDMPVEEGIRLKRVPPVTRRWLAHPSV